MDTTNFNPTASMPLDQSAASNGKRYMKAGATALTEGAIGSVMPIVIGKVKGAITNIDTEPSVESDSTTETTSSANVAWADDNIEIAIGVNDNMSFNEAFAAARSEVGAGGAFEWRGNVYGTYYAEEWNSMTPDAKAEYNSHFSWNNIETPSGHHESIVSDNIEVVSVDHSISHASASEVEVVAAEPEIEVLGVAHDMQTGSNIGGLSVDGQDVFLIDVDGDFEFDLMASDLNQNNIVDAGEVVDIQGQGMTVDHLCGISEITESLNGEDELPDYMVDNTYKI